MATLKNFNTALYVMRLDADCKYDGLLKIGISNNVERRAKEVGSVKIEYQDDYRAPRALVMATEMLAQTYAYRKVGRPKNFRQALPVRSGSSEFFNTDNIRQARGFVGSAKRRVNVFADEEGYQDIYDDDEKHVLEEALIDLINRITNYVKDLFRAMKKRLPQSFRLEIARIYQTLQQEKAA
jgi:predicted GIY-YIG superfamily endonuclease